jgi:Fe-S cluster assembly ATPase SufC
VKEIINTHKILMADLKGKDHLEEQGVDERMILKCILNKLNINVWTGYINPLTGPNGCFVSMVKAPIKG